MSRLSDYDTRGLNKMMNELAYINVFEGSDTPEAMKMRAAFGQSGAGSVRAAHIRNIQQEMREEMVKKRMLKARLFDTRFTVASEFYYNILRHLDWRRSLKEAYDGPSVFSAVHPWKTIGDYHIKRPAFITAMWNAISVPAGFTFAVTAFDNYLRQLFDAFDGEGLGSIDYRDLLNLFSTLRCSPEGPVTELIREWYRNYDGDATRGLTIAQWTRLLSSLCGSNIERDRIAIMFDVPSFRALHERRKAEKEAGKHSWDGLFAAAAEIRNVHDVKTTDETIIAGLPRTAMVPPKHTASLPALIHKDLNVEPETGSADEPIPAHIMMEWLADQPALLAELQRQREERMHPKLKEWYRSQVKIKAERKAREKKAEVDDTEKCITADRQYLYRLKWTGWINWKRWYMARMAVLRRIQLGQKRRAVVLWRRFAKHSKEEHFLKRIAKDHNIRRRGKVSFDAWVAWLEVRRAVHAANETRALEYYDYALQTKVINGWRAVVHDERATKHRRKLLLTMVFRAWDRFALAKRRRRLAAAAANEQAAAILTAAQEEINKEEEDEKAAEEAAEFAAKAAEFQAEADAAQRAAAHEAAKELAARRNRSRQLLAQQEEDRRKARKADREQQMDEFQREWRKKALTGAEEAREAARTWATTTPEGIALMDENAHKLLTLTNVRDGNQEMSEFRAELSLKDGCIHFLRDPVWPPGVKPGTRRVKPLQPGIDWNVEFMKLKDAMVVAIAHYAAKKAHERKLALEKEQVEANAELIRKQAATMMQRAWRAARARRKILSEVLAVFIEQLVDPYSGEIYWLNNGARWLASFHTNRVEVRKKLEAQARAKAEADAAAAAAAEAAARKKRFGRFASKATIAVPSAAATALVVSELTAKLDAEQLAAAVADGQAVAGRPLDLHHMLAGQGLYPKPDWCVRYTGDGSFYYQRLYRPPRRARGWAAESPEGSPTNSPGKDGGSPSPSSPGSPPRRGGHDDEDGELADIAYEPPADYILCRACGVDFATRTCTGNECDGYPYCFACFQQYHPLDHPDYAAHWAPNVGVRLPVRPGGKLRDTDLPLHKRQKRRPYPEIKRRLFGGRKHRKDDDSDDEAEVAKMREAALRGKAEGSGRSGGKLLKRGLSRMMSKGKNAMTGGSASSVGSASEAEGEGGGASLGRSGTFGSMSKRFASFRKKSSRGGGDGSMASDTDGEAGGGKSSAYDSSDDEDNGRSGIVSVKKITDVTDDDLLAEDKAARQRELGRAAEREKAARTNTSGSGGSGSGSLSRTGSFVSGSGGGPSGGLSRGPSMAGGLARAPSMAGGLARTQSTAGGGLARGQSFRSPSSRGF